MISKFFQIKILLSTLVIFLLSFHNVSAKKIVIAHRGASAYIPEHTLAGAIMAYTQGADYIELDVVMTKDEYLVVMHDLTLNATTNVEDIFPERGNKKGKYYVIDFNLKEIQSLKVHERLKKNGKDAAFPSRFPIKSQLFRVPTLEDMILLVKGLSKSFGRKVGLYIELKAPTFHRKHRFDISEKLLSLLYRHGYKQKSDNIFIQSFDSTTLKSLRFKHKTNIKLIQLIGENKWKLSDADFNYLRSDEGMKEVAKYADGIGPWINQVVTGIDYLGKPQISNIVPNARRYSLLIHPYTFRKDLLPNYVSSFEELLKIFINDVQVDGIFTDFPDLVVDFIKNNSSN
mgnify:CR=1 FL=1